VNDPRYNNRQENNHRGWERDMYPVRWVFVYGGMEMFLPPGVTPRDVVTGGQSVGTCRPGCIDNCPGGSQPSKDVTSVEAGK
jgi:hypothetical protein